MDLIFFFSKLKCVEAIHSFHTTIWLDKEKEGEQEGAVCFDSAKEGTS